MGVTFAPAHPYTERTVHFKGIRNEPTTPTIILTPQP